MKKPYRPPKLSAYGNLAQMTQMRAMMGGQFDNMMLTKRT
jgi:hypothetical protein